MNLCTDFCERLKSINPKHGVLPLHDELVAQLKLSDNNPDEDKDVPEALLGTWQDLQQRTQCTFCQLAVAAISASVETNGSDAIPGDQPISILIFPDEQSFRLSYPSRLGLRLAFVAENARYVSGADTARQVHKAGVQISQIKDWLRTCDEEHEACSLHPIEDEDSNGIKLNFLDFDFLERDTSNFRLIDLDLGCVRRATLDYQYVTLSYVWGDLPMLRLQTDNFEQLSAVGSLEAIRTELPRTVNDAIDLVKALNERYLWVDGLCLVQDDETDVSLGIEMMNSIYHESYFTIVAASGVDANSGLPGINETTRDGTPVQFIQEISSSIKMTFLHSIDWHLNRSFYNRRGWTLQEIVLPRRTVIFINGQVYFRCLEANWSEEMWTDKWTHWLDADDSNISRTPDPNDGFLPSFWAYQKLCEEYSQRRLRRDGDALRALTGVSRLVASGMETLMIEGLPGYYLDHFLLFISSNGDLRRRSEFASFSWAGWEGRIMWPRENFVWYDCRGEHKWEVTNIIKYLKHNSIVQWNSLDSRAHRERLTSTQWDIPSPLLELMRKYPAIFSNTHQNPEEDHRNWPWSNSGGGHSDMPEWDRGRDSLEDDENEDKDVIRMQQPLPHFSIKGFDLANGQAEFYRLVRRLEHNSGMGPLLRRLSLQNWIATRYLRVRRARERSSSIRPGPSSREAERGNYDFRPPRVTRTETLESESEIEDSRTTLSRNWADQRAVNNETFNEDFVIPDFPPYTILQFVAISMHLILGATAGPNSDSQSAFDRIPGIPLLCVTRELVGSLHPDNYNLLEAPGSKAEFVIISRCNSPTVGSALVSSDGANMKSSWNLFWVLQISWKDGIAERKGVGQVLSSALETSVDSKPKIKTILLG